MQKETNFKDKAKQYATELLTNQLPLNFYYHNINHTQEVVDWALLIADKEKLSEDDKLVLELAAWFHDLGHVFVQENHELKSIELAKAFLVENEASTELVDSVCSCIEGTIMPQNPKTELAKVLCDADLYHLSTDQFEEKSDLLYKELHETNDSDLKEYEWQQESYEFIKNHNYFTTYGNDQLTPQKDINIRRAKKRLKKIRLKNIPTRGIETMFRTTSKNHLELSAMADNKANIMISINSIILSIIVSVLIRRLEEYPHFIFPTIVITVVCLSTIVLSVLATRPKIIKKNISIQDIKDRNVSLLFFGNIQQLTLKEYEWGMKEMMKDGDFLYNSMIKDIYYLGAVLAKKYKLLRWSYTVFMYGFVAAVLAFVIAEIFFKSYYMY